MKRVCIIQSSYIPWLGFFDMIRRSDEYIALDCAQYTKRDWRNRNFLQFHSCVGRLTVPVVKGSRQKPIEEVEIAGPEWAYRHWKSISQAYAKAPYFASYKDYFEPIYRNPPTMLSVLNRRLIDAVLAALNIKTICKLSTDYGRFHGKIERLVMLCKSAGATHYLTGPKAKNYLDEKAFLEAGVTVEWMEYTYPPYRQFRGGPFIPQLSILDAIFNEGPNVVDIMKANG